MKHLTLPMFAFCLLPLSAQAQAPSSGFSYNDFSSTPHLRMQGDVKIVNDLLRLSNETQVYSKGSAWDDRAQSVAQGFSSEFDFQFSQSSGSDGFRFYVQSEGIPVTGGEHSPLEGVQVFFDTFQNAWNFSDHDLSVSVTSGGSGYEIEALPCSVDFADTLIHHAKIEYRVDGNRSSTLNVYVDDMTMPELSVALDLDAAILLQPNGEAWMGFQCPGGGSPQNSDILSWEVAPSAPRLEVENLIAGQVALVSIDNATPNDFVYFVWSFVGGGPINTPFGTGYISSPYNVVPLAVDSAGHAGMTQHIPSGMVGMNIWFHGADRGSGTMLNAIAETIH